MLRLPCSFDGKTEIVIFGKNITVYTKNQYYYSEPPKVYQRVFVEDGNHGNGGWEVNGLDFEQVIKLIEEHCK
jgi:hypothetical protein